MKSDRRAPAIDMLARCASGQRHQAVKRRRLAFAGRQRRVGGEHHRAAAGYDVHARDIHDYGCGYEVADFLFFTGDTDRDIVTNPPYSMAENFIERALAATRAHGRRVAMLFRLEYSSANRRRRLFRDHPAFDAKWELTRRPRWAGDGAGSPRHNFAWYVWDWSRDRNAPPKIGWIE